MHTPSSKVLPETSMTFQDLTDFSMVFKDCGNPGSEIKPTVK